MSNPKHQFTEKELQDLAKRVLESQRIQPGYFELGDDSAPTVRQVAAVIRTLADFTHAQVMVGPKVKNLAGDDYEFGPAWKHASGLGRYFHLLADNILDEEQHG